MDQLGNPFIYGRPLRGGEFMYRSDELRTVQNRLGNGESTAIIGEPHTGKTSFLLQLAQPEVINTLLYNSQILIHIKNIDLHSVESEYCPEDFWAEALATLKERDLPSVKTLLRNASSNGYSRGTLIKLFTSLREQNHLLVLLLDEFERLLVHKNFVHPSFFALLRSLSTSTGGLALVIASRLNLAVLNNLGRGLLDTGSPFFNNMIEVKLPAFSDDEIEMFLSTNGPGFSRDERSFIRRTAGRNPYLIQAMAATLHEILALQPTQNHSQKDFKALENPEASKEACKKAASLFFFRINHYFADLWDSMDSNTRTVAVILGLKYLDGRAVGSAFNYDDIRKTDWYGIELQKLSDLGLADLKSKNIKTEWFNEKLSFLWNGESWVIGCEAFTWWLRDVIISPDGNFPKFDAWRRNHEYKNLLTQKQMGDLQNIVYKIPVDFIRGVSGFAAILFEEIRKVY